ncbi:MAG: EamA family transporter, partial [Anaerolineales bacterium]
MATKARSSSTSRILADMSLLLAAILWGSSFAAQRAAALSGGVYLYNGVRFLLGSLFLLPFLLLSKSNLKHITPRAWLGGGLAGLALFAGSSFQQFGMQFTSAANAGFITGLYVILIPFFMAFIYRKTPRGLV